VIGGLVVSQLLTLFITPVLYLYLERVSGVERRLFRISKRQPASSVWGPGWLKRGPALLLLWKS